MVGVQLRISGGLTVIGQACDITKTVTQIAEREAGGGRDMAWAVATRSWKSFQEISLLHKGWHFLCLI